jgi:hypothetical protein
MEIRFDGDQVIVIIAKGVLVLSREAFIEALRQGKRWRRKKALTARQPTTPGKEQEACW